MLPRISEAINSLLIALVEDAVAKMLNVSRERSKHNSS